MIETLDRLTLSKKGQTMGTLTALRQGNTYPVSYIYENSNRTVQKHFPCANEEELIRFLQEDLRVDSDGII
jgi:hypothetical protein